MATELANPVIAEGTAALLDGVVKATQAETVQAGAPVGNQNAAGAHENSGAKPITYEDHYANATKLSSQANRSQTWETHQKAMVAHIDAEKAARQAGRNSMAMKHYDHSVYHQNMLAKIDPKRFKGSDATQSNSIKAADGKVLDFSSLAHAAASIQVAHWAADTVTNAHAALGKLYEDVSGLVDTLAEAYAGRTGLLPESADPGAVVAGVLDVVEKARASVPEGAEDLRNILADMEQAANKAKYLLKAMDETKADTVKAAWSDAARKAALEARKQHGHLVGKSFNDAHEDLVSRGWNPDGGVTSPGKSYRHYTNYRNEAVRLHVKEGKIHEVDSDSTGKTESVWDRMSPEQKRRWESKDREDAARQAAKNLGRATNQSMSEENTIQCRAAVGTQLPTETWRPGDSVSFVYAPEGVHQITAGFRKNDTISICVMVDEATAPVLQESFDHLTATNPKQEPYADEDHEGRKATLRFPAGGTRFSWGKVRGEPGVVITGGQPTSYGAEVVNGRVYRSYSPEFASDADYAKASRTEEGHWTFPDGVRGSEGNPARIVGVNFVIGALTNRPAFRAMPAVKAKHAVVEVQDTVTASGTSEGAIEGWKKRKLSGDVHILSHPNAEEFAKDYHKGELGNFRSGVSGERQQGDEAAAEHLWTKYDRVSSKPRFAGTGSELWKNKETGEHYHIESSPTGKGFYGMEKLIEKAKPHHMSLHGATPVQATDSTSSSTVQATWSDAARQASAEARKSHEHQLSEEAHYATGIALKGRGAINEDALWSDAHDRHLSAASAHRASGSPSMAEEHEAMAAHHKLVMKNLRGYDVNKTKAHTPSSIDSVVIKSEAVLADASKRREAAEAVLESVIPRPPKPPERGPATCADDVLDDLRAAEVAKAGGHSAALDVLDAVKAKCPDVKTTSSNKKEAKNFQPVG